MDFGVLSPFVIDVVLDRLHFLFADEAFALLSALFGNEEGVSLGVDALQINRGDFGAAHPGLYERIDDGAVTPGAVAFSARALVRKLCFFIAPSVTGPSTDNREVIGGIEELAAFGFGERPLELQDPGDGKALQLLRWISKRKRPQLVDPFAEGFEMRNNSINGPVRPSSSPFFLHFAAQRVNECSGKPRRPLRPLITTRLRDHKLKKQPQVPMLFLL